jgi:16S rRNA G527 N7-methylase RsmG
VESTGKKAHFLNMVSAELGLLKRVTVHNQRAELMAQYVGPGTASFKPVPRGTHSKSAQSGKESNTASDSIEADISGVPRGTVPNLRNSADAVFFRGVARLASLVELGAPLLKVGGLLIAYKGPKAGEELREAAKAMKEMKIELDEQKDFILPGVLEARSLVCLRKTGETLRRFPRPVGLAQKEPLL